MIPVLVRCSRNRGGMGNLVVLLLAERAQSRIYQAAL